MAAAPSPHRQNHQSGRLRFWASCSAASFSRRRRPGATRWALADQQLPSQAAAAACAAGAELRHLTRRAAAVRRRRTGRGAPAQGRRAALAAAHRPAARRGARGRRPLRWRGQEVGRRGRARKDQDQGGAASCAQMHRHLRTSMRCEPSGLHAPASRPPGARLHPGSQSRFVPNPRWCAPASRLGSGQPIRPDQD